MFNATVQLSLFDPGQSDDWLKVMAFKSGGHYCFLKHSAAVDAEIAKLLKKVVAKKAMQSKPLADHSHVERVRQTVKAHN